MSTPNTSTPAAPRLQQILYLSRLVSGCSYDVFAAICRVARAHNTGAELRGVLVFDGHRFGQLIEGPAPAAQALMARITRDPRHTALQLRVDRLLPGPPSFSDWRPGFCAPDELDVFDGPQGLRDGDAIGAFFALVGRADLSP